MRQKGYEIRPRSRVSLDLVREVWFFRHLIGIFIWRDILVRYKNTVIGAAWYLFQPLCMMLTFTVFFSHAFTSYIGSVPYPLFSYSGLLLWQMFSRSLSLGASSLTMFEAIIAKIYFPRIIAPLSMVLGTVFDFAIAGVLLVILMTYYGVGATANIFFIPIIVWMVLLCAMGLSLILSALDAKYRDIRHTIPLVIQIWMFCTPIMYPVAYVPEQWRRLYELNPMVGLTEWFRWLLLSCGNQPSVSSLYMSAAMSLSMFFIGVYVFQNAQGNIIDTL